ncbi:zinc ribbon domain-containing protein [Halonatronum saccharophilum]|uniref:zinc ribbon domain-containing protein n=1 Tax=Halonatronum saccharophilum TaxID=150060 RepID=UPI0004B090AD|nr:C4-type zinc ribbon domain-containing protein [Halonatronum saccharophilum]
MNKVELLYKLQGIDDRIKEVERKLESVSNLKEVGVREEDLFKREEALGEGELKLKELKKRAKDIEFEDDLLLRKEKDYKEQLYSGEIGNPKELEKLQDKLRKVSENKGEVEEKLLELMMEIEEGEGKLSEGEDELNKIREKVKELKREEEFRKDQYKEELEELKRDKEEVKRLLEDGLISKYNDLYRRKSYKAVAKLEDGYCMGCRISLPFNLVREVKEADEMVLCDNCGRMLYYKG